jgi:hypothetical protein
MQLIGMAPSMGSTGEEGLSPVIGGAGTSTCCVEGAGAVWAAGWPAWAAETGKAVSNPRNISKREALIKELLSEQDEIACSMDRVYAV